MKIICVHSKLKVNEFAGMFLLLIYVVVFVIIINK